MTSLSSASHNAPFFSTSIVHLAFFFFQVTCTISVVSFPESGITQKISLPADGLASRYAYEGLNCLG